jgi:hypothetical protein
MSWEPEPNTFYEPRPAIAPYMVVKEDTLELYDAPFNDRADAEEVARERATQYGSPFYVVGCVSISSVPQPVPLKASTRALV